MAQPRKLTQISQVLQALIHSFVRGGLERGVPAHKCIYLFCVILSHVWSRITITTNGDTELLYLQRAFALTLSSHLYTLPFLSFLNPLHLYRDTLHSFCYFRNVA